MKRILMPATALAAMKKMAFVILGCALLMLVARPAKAELALDPCNHPTIGTPANVPSNFCGVVITITGTSGNLVATITGSLNPYDESDDQLVGIQNNSSVKIGAIVLKSAGDGPNDIFGFDGDGPCSYGNPGAWCPSPYPAANNPNDPNPVGYEGPDNTFVGISPDLTTGKVLFITPLPPSPDGGVTPGGSTWFALEEAPTNVVAIGENQTLTAGTTAIYKFGPGNPTDPVVPGLNPGSEDDFKITPLVTNGVSPTGDSLTVTPLKIDPALFGAAAPFNSLACVPYFDYSSNSDGSNNTPVCIEIEVDCTGADSCAFQNDIQLDYGVYGPGVAAGNLIGGPHLLVKHGVACPTTAFDTDIFLSYTGASSGPAASPDPPPIKGGSKTGPSCYVSAYDPTILANSPQLIQPGVTVGFPGFQQPVSNTLNPSCQAQLKPLILPVNCIVVPLPVPLLWTQTDNAGNKITNLKLCKNTSCPTGGANPPWVNLSLTVLSPAPACQALATTNLPSVLNSGLVNLGKGQYGFLWNTLANPKGLTGCLVQPVLTFSSGAPAAPAVFLYAN